MTAEADPTPIRIFLLDDHEVVRRGLRDLFADEDDLVVVGESGSAADAVDQLATLQADVAVLDARLPDGNGISVCRDLRSRHPQTAAVILTSYDDEEALIAAVLAGAAGYVLKQIRGNELVDAVRRVAAGESLIDPAVSARAVNRLRPGPEAPAGLRALTPREQEILGLIAEGLTNRQIGQRLFLAEKTVKNYVSNLLAKLGLERRTQAAVLAARMSR